MKTLADGQLAATETAIFTCGQDSSSTSPAPSVGATTVSLSVRNTSGSLTETVQITFQRGSNGSTTSRKFPQMILGTNESGLIANFVLDNGDKLLGSTSDATTVDYILTTGTNGPFQMQTFDANGQVKTINSTSVTAATTITSTSANALTVGANGTTNPQLQVDDSTSSVATGIKIKGAAAAGGCAISVISSTTNEALTIDAKGSGTITIGGTSTGAVVLPTTNITDGKNIVLATTTGTSFGGATTQKLSFYGVTPITQPAASSATSVTGTTGASTGVSLDTTFTGGGTAQFTIGGIVTRLKALGLLAT